MSGCFYLDQPTYYLLCLNELEVLKVSKSLGRKATSLSSIISSGSAGKYHGGDAIVALSKSKCPLDGYNSWQPEVFDSQNIIDNCPLMPALNNKSHQFLILQTELLLPNPKIRKIRTALGDKSWDDLLHSSLLILVTPGTIAYIATQALNSTAVQGSRYPVSGRLLADDQATSG
ncbi:hypothetical protein SERLADRAFT_404794 [Serpula lacrymans var. lacrymans S7.9]|uniref:Uncharacterized protein n=1 Tax=Serpula lacrymans var. lacrymans (strain S7.9) TaxID=578457 RepID=F8NF14_SERL9|nr:uncharacterized protein SERLADRAFT_404794 [Serpula lacrymans var. lacrymans S7.9]EGO30773.1 hypothetical protein SERLADRAFT_404794 [Serpula lacrymans var. lacrymans S7.9]